MTLVLDAGALIAFERRDRDVLTLIDRAVALGEPWLTHGGVVGQVWRNPARQVPLTRMLRGAEVRPLDASLGRDAGLLLAEAGTADVIDAALVALMTDGDEVITSDPGDLRILIEAADIDVIVRVV